MIELYVGITLLGLGYLIQQQNTTQLRTVPNEKKQLNKGELPMSVPMANAIEARRVNQTFQEGVQGKAIMRPPSSNKLFSTAPPSNTFRSELSGQITEQRHNNMQPYGRVKALGGGLSDRSLETFTGSTTYYQPKKEVEALFKPQMDVGNINGMPVNTSYFMDRIAPPKAQKNVLPFQQIRVGPGVGQGYECGPKGGYQQFEIQELARPRTVDELRVGSQPKTTYEGRVVEGQKGSKRGMVAPMQKNRVETYYEQTPDMYLPTTGAVLKPRQKPQPIDKLTNRPETSRPYKGTAYQPSGAEQRPAVQVPHRQALRALPVGVATVPHGNAKGDYGKASIQVYANERDITSTKTVSTNVTSMVKAIIAPLEDLLKPSRKELSVDAPDHKTIQVQFPNKQTIYNPNAPTRTTIKETLIHDSENLNIKPPKGVGVVYDPAEIARTTMRQTMDRLATEINTAVTRKAGAVYNPEDPAKVTIRQTTEGKTRAFGNMANTAPSALPVDQYDVAETQRNATDAVGASDYAGNPARPTADGYEVFAADARTTQRQFVADNEYYGTAQTTSAKAPRSYEDIMNLEMSDGLKEELEIGREPTQTGVKVFNGDIAEMTRTVQDLPDMPAANPERVTNIPLSAGDLQFTRQHDDLDEVVENIIDADILEPFKNNPYTQSLNSFA
jgi:hypothetical protein